MVSKDVGIRIRVERALRDDFRKVCRVKGKPAAQILRDYMSACVAELAVAGRPRSGRKNASREPDADRGK